MSRPPAGAARQHRASMYCQNPLFVIVWFSLWESEPLCKTLLFIVRLWWGDDPKVLEAKTLKEIYFTLVLSLVDAGARCAMVRSRGEKREFGGGLWQVSLVVRV